MAIKIKRVIPILLFMSVMLSACSKAEDTEIDTVTISDYSAAENTEFNNEIGSITGYYMRSYTDFIIYEQSFASSQPDRHIETYYAPTEIYFAEGEEGDVPMDSLKTGDKIEVDIGLIAASYPGQARIYGLRLIEAGDVSNINDSALLHLEDCGIHAVIGEKTEQPSIMRYSGYFVRTETECFLVPADKYGLLSGIEFLKIHPAAELGVSGVSLDGFKTGDRIWVDVMLVQELYPPIAPIFGATLIEEGDISNIDREVLSKFSELGYTAVE